MIRHPELVSGTGRTCEILIRSCAGSAVVKTGAEGVYAAIVPRLGLGVAIKIDDGAGRAAETAVTSILHSMKLFADDAPATALLKAPVTNTRGSIVGEHRPAPTLLNIRIDRRLNDIQ
jgi:L-asparaginase II